MLLSPEVSSCPSAITTIMNTLSSYTCCRIYSQGEILSHENLSERLDNQYFEASRYAFFLTPSAYQLTPKFRISFQKFFHISWSDALNNPHHGGVYNAIEAMRRYHLSSRELSSLWCAAVERNQIFSFSKEIHCGLLEYSSNGIETIASPLPLKFFCINGFYPLLKEKYNLPRGHKTPEKRRRRHEKLFYCCLEWDPNTITWESFNHDVIGHVNHSLAVSSSIRGQLHEKWQDLTGKEPPRWNGFDCPFLHCSESAWDGMRDRLIWLNISLENDMFGQQLIEAGVNLDQLLTWSSRNSFLDKKSSVVFGESHYTISELLQGKDIHECIAIALEALSSRTGRLSYRYSLSWIILLSLTDGTSLLSSPVHSHSSPYTASDASIAFYSTPTAENMKTMNRRPQYLTPILSPVVNTSANLPSTPTLMNFTPLATSSKIVTCLSLPLILCRLWPPLHTLCLSSC